jgi:hypothetical protein
MRERRGRLPRSKQLDAPLQLRPQHALCVDRHDALTREQQAHGVLQSLFTNRAYDLGDAHTRYTGRMLYIARWSIETKWAHTRWLWAV